MGGHLINKFIPELQKRPSEWQSWSYASTYRLRE